MPYLITDIISLYLPQLQQLLRPQPVRRSDQVALPNSPHRLATASDPLAIHVLTQLRTSTHVVKLDTFNDAGTLGRGFLLSFVDDPHALQLRDETPTVWHLLVQQRLLPLVRAVLPTRQFVLQAQDLARKGYLQSAMSIRRAVHAESWIGQDAAWSDNVLAALSTASSRDQLWCYPCSSIPPSIRAFEEAGRSYLVLHDRIRTTGPWIVTEESHRDQVESDLQRHASQVIDSASITVKDGHSSGHAAERLDGRVLLEITKDGKFGERLRFHLLQSCRDRRAAKLGTILLAPIPVTRLGLPAIGRVVLFASAHIGERGSIARLLATQVATMLMSPPPEVNSDWTNVASIRIIMERTDNADTAWAHRPAISQIVQSIQTIPDLLVCAVNIERITRLPAELAQVRAALPRLKLLGTSTVVHERRRELAEFRDDEELQRQADDDDGMGEDEDVEGGGGAEELDDEEDEEQVIWTDGTDPRLAAQLSLRQAQTSELSFYRKLQIYLTRISLSRQDIIQTSIASFLATQHPDFFVLSRVSQGEVDQYLTYNASIERQRVTIGRLVPDGLRSLTLEQVSIGGDAISVTAKLAAHPGSTIFATSLDRIARNRASMAAIREQCRQDQTHVVVFCWPSQLIAQLQALPQNPLLNPAALALLASTVPVATSARSLPSLWPVLIAGPLRDPSIDAIVDAQLALSEAYLDRVGKVSYVGDRTLAVHTLLTPGKFSFQQFGVEIDLLFHTILPNYSATSPACYNSNYHHQVQCHGGNACLASCRCNCAVCVARYATLCTNAHASSLCCCTVDGAH